MNDDSPQKKEPETVSNDWVQPRDQLETMDKEVDEIVSEEADTLLQVEDEARASQFDPPTPDRRSFVSSVKRLFRAWWMNARLRNATLIGFFIVIVASMLVPVSRYALLNTFGVRVRASTVVVDAESGRPLKNIPVRLQGQELRTNDDGFVAFDNLKQGPTTIQIQKLGFAPYEKTVTLGWGSNPLDNQSIVVTGARFNFVLKDWLSGEVLKDTEASSGDSVGQSDVDGNIELVVGEVDETTEVVLSAQGYREERLKLQEIKNEENAVLMVTAKKHPFISNRTGEYDLYTIDADAKNEKLLLKATKNEREVPFVLPHPTRDVFAFVSSRDGETNKDGFVLDGLFIVDSLTAETYKVTRSEQIQVIGWDGDKLIYVAVVEGVSAGNSQRSKLISYDLDTKIRTDLASSNYFNDVKLINGTVYFALSSYAVPRSQAKLFAIKTDGSDRRTVIDEQVWSILRTDYDTVLFNTESNVWYEQKASQDVTKLDTQPIKQDSRTYAVSPNGEHAAWIDIRDGKGVLLVWSVEEKKETQRIAGSGIVDPVYWLDDTHIVYRVMTSDETADYVVHITTGNAQKIADVIGNRSRYFY